MKLLNYIKNPPEKMMQNDPRINSKALRRSLFRHFLFFENIVDVGPVGDQGQGLGTWDQGQGPGTSDQGPGTWDQNPFVP